MTRAEIIGKVAKAFYVTFDVQDKETQLAMEERCSMFLFDLEACGLEVVEKVASPDQERAQAFVEGENYHD